MTLKTIQIKLIMMNKHTGNGFRSLLVTFAICTMSWFSFSALAAPTSTHRCPIIIRNNYLQEKFGYLSLAWGTKNATTIQPITPATQTMIRMGSVFIKKIVEIATIVAISKIIYTRLRRVKPPLSRYSRIYLPKKDCNSHACKRGELR